MAAAAALGAATTQPQKLALGAPAERPLAGGEAHSYAIDPLDPIATASGARLLLTVEQRGIDVVVEVRRLDGSLLVAVDSPTDSEGPETVLLPAEMPEPLEVRVLSPSPGVAPGTYVIRLDELPGGTPAERERLEAERLMTEAAASNRRGGADGKRLAADLYARALLRWRALDSRRQEAQCLLALGGIDTALGQPKPALEHYRQALELLLALADEPGQAAAWSGIGLAETALGDAGNLAGAAAAQRQALALERRLGRPYEEGKALNNLGFALHSQGELRAALDLYQQALATFERAGEQGFWKANVLHNLAALYVALGEPDAALTSNQQVLALQRSLGDRRGEARTLTNLGAIYVDLGELGKALDAYTPALARFRRSGDRLWEAALLHNRGTAYYGLGDFQHALADFARALAIRRQAGDRKGEALTEIAIGRTRLQLGETGPALDLARRAVDAAQAAADHRGEMLARLLVARLDLATGEAAAALTELSRALDLARLLEDRLDEVSIRQLTGEAHLALHHPAEAARELGEAVALARAVKAPARTIAALTALARAERRLDRPAAARSRADEALRLIETSRTADTDPDLRATYLAAQRSTYELAIDLRMELERRQPGHGHAAEALEVSERAHARSLLDLLQEAHADVHAGVDPRLRGRERGLLARLSAKAGRQAELLSRAATAERRRAADEEVRSVLDDLAQVEAEIRRSSPRYAALTQPPLATSRQIRGLLDGASLLLEYSLGEERSFLWAVERDVVRGFELPPRARIEAAARAVYDRLAVLPQDDRELGEAAASLSRMLLGPVAPRLGTRRLIVVADGELQYIPFGALPVPGAAPAAPLLARHEVVNAPSASAIALERRLSRRRAAPGAVAVLADPVFGRDSFPRLPWTRREAEAIAAVAPRDRSLFALGFQASRATALSPRLARYQVVHFATHGIIDARTPALSGLMLSRIGEHGQPREGFLGLRDIYNLRLGADLVVLSGCETALGKQVRGEGLLGLTQGFLYSGARQVLASLWRIEDQATAELMARFYRALLLDGSPPAAALRQAQLAIQQDPRWRSPYYWSGFVLQGDWTGYPPGLR